MKNYEELMLKAYAMYWHASYNNLRSKLEQISETARFPIDLYQSFHDMMRELEEFDKLDKFDKLEKFQGLDVEDFERYIQENVIKSDYVEAIIDKRAEDRVMTAEKEQNYLADIEMLEKYSRDLEERLEKRYGEKLEKEEKQEKEVTVYLKGDVPKWILNDFAEFLECGGLDYNGEDHYAYLDEDDAERFTDEIIGNYSDYFIQCDDYCFEYNYK